MKILKLTTIILLQALVLSSVSAQQGHGQGQGQGKRGSGMGPGMGRMQQSITDSGAIKKDSLSTLRQFASLSDKQLLAMRDVIDTILGMSPEERNALKAKVAEYEKLDPARQQLIRQGWGHVSEDYKNDWRQMMQSLDESERREIQEKMQSLSFEERIEYRIRKIDEWRKTKE